VYGLWYLDEGARWAGCGRVKAMRKEHRHARAGSVAVELALTSTLLLLILTALFDLGLAAYEWMQVESAAEAGAQWAEQNGWDQTQIANAVVAATGGSITATPAPSQVCGCSTNGSFSQISCSSKCSGNVQPGTYAQVSAQAQHYTVLVYPGLPNPITFTATAITRLK